VKRAGTIVLLYHRVARLERDPHGLAVAPERFTAHCEVLRRRFEVVRLLDANPSRRQVAITFDDGYADNVIEARPILATAGLPATFFITAGRIGQSGEAWWDRLEQIVWVSAPPIDSLELDIAGSRLWVDLRSPGARERAYWALFWRLRPLRPAVIESVLVSVACQLQSPTDNRATHRWMTTDELRLLAEAANVDVGAHTLTHPLLASLSAEEQRQEIAGSRALLEQMVGGAPTLFSYPHGSPDAFNDLTLRLVRDAGYRIACIATRGIARAGSDPLRVPRNVVRDWEADQFEAWLDEWMRRM
jgi:peptidoglycan/xylan/chitin deacetylase (PgdA/CDA1 family)